MLNLFLPCFVVLFTIFSAYGFEDVEKFQERIKALDEFKQTQWPKIQEESDKKIKEVTSINHPSILSYDKKIQSEALKVMDEQFKMIRSESEEISFSHIDVQLKKYLALKQQRQQYLEAVLKTEDLKSNTGNTKNLQKYMELMSSPTTSVQDAMIEGRYLLLSKADKEIADEFKKNIYHAQREANVQEALEKEIKINARKIEESLKIEEGKINAALSSEKILSSEYEKFSKHMAELDENHQFTWNISSYVSQDKIGGFSCDPKINAKYYRFKNYPNLVAFNNGKDYNTIVSLDKNNPQSFNQVYTCIKGEYGCFDKKAPALCGLDPECKIHLEAAVNAYKTDGYQSFKNNLLYEAVEKNKSDNFKDGNLINELFKEKKLSEADVKKLKELHDSVGAELRTLKNNNPEEFHKEVKKKIDSIVDMEKANPKLSKNVQLGFIFMLQGIKSKVGEFKGQYFLEMNSFKFCPGDTDSTKAYCSSYANFQKQVAKFDDVEELQNFTSNECPIISFRIMKSGLPSQQECQIQPDINGIDDLIKIQEVLKKSN